MPPFVSDNRMKVQDTRSSCRSRRMHNANHLSDRCEAQGLRSLRNRTQPAAVATGIDGSVQQIQLQMLGHGLSGGGLEARYAAQAWGRQAFCQGGEVFFKA